MKPERLAAVCVAGLAVALLVAERRRPLRPRVEDQTRRDLRNLVVGLMSAVTVATLQRPLVEPLARTVERRRWGLAQRLPLPGWGRTLLAIALMDYTLYLWHVLTHRAPFLWRFHAAHHADRDLTATTALRFHFAEMALSIPYRAAQVLLLGSSVRALKLWQTLTLGCILFHHSNLRLPARVESIVGWLLATPRMHGVHHSIVKAERDSNWSSGLSIWDRLHGTLRLDMGQADVRVGVRGFLDDGHASLSRVLAGPFRRDDVIRAQAALDSARGGAGQG